VTTGREGDAALGHWTENRPSAGWLPRMDLRELWARRELVYFLALRDFKLQYAQTLLGAAWVLLQPLLGAVVFYFVFGKALDVPSEGIPYLVFAYAGLLVWTYVSNSVSAAAESLATHSALVTKVYFPRIAAPVASTLPGLVDLAVALVLLGILMAVYGVAPSAALLTLPLWIVAIGIVALAVGLCLSALNAQYRDVRYALRFFLQIWFFASPIAYSSSVFDGAAKYVFAANPLVAVLDGFRWSVIDAPAPGSEDLISLGVTLVLLVAGVLYFFRVERRLADLV
jgi:lipopolysaccharide transport system permease protein